MRLEERREQRRIKARLKATIKAIEKKIEQRRKEEELERKRSGTGADKLQMLEKEASHLGGETIDNEEE